MAEDSGTDGQYAQRRFHLEESITTTNGARTTFIEYMAPGTQVPPHYHNQFSETFDLISGPMRVYSSEQPHAQEADLEVLEQSAQEVRVGQHITVEPGIYHKYVVGDGNAVLRVILTPGNADFETLLKVLDGLTHDGKVEEMSSNPLLMSIVMDLADSHLLGPVGQALSKIKEDDADAMEKLRKELLLKYDTDVALERLMKKE